MFSETPFFTLKILITNCFSCNKNFMHKMHYTWFDVNCKIKSLPCNVTHHQNHCTLQNNSIIGSCPCGRLDARGHGTRCPCGWLHARYHGTHADLGIPHPWRGASTRYPVWPRASATPHRGTSCYRPPLDPPWCLWNNLNKHGQFICTNSFSENELLQNHYILWGLNFRGFCGSHQQWIYAPQRTILWCFKRNWNNFLYR